MAKTVGVWFSQVTRIKVSGSNGLDAMRNRNLKNMDVLTPEDQDPGSSEDSLGRSEGFKSAWSECSDISSGHGWKWSHVS